MLKVIDNPHAAAAELATRRQARRGLLAFTRYTMPDYETNWHHAVIASALDDLYSGVIRFLLIKMPPRHGKSELASRRFPAYVLGRNPNSRIIATSYSASSASRFNRDVQRILDDPSYSALFPETGLNSSNVRTQSGQALRNNSIFEPINPLKDFHDALYSGFYLSSGIGGNIIGTGFDLGILDDGIKSREMADSDTQRRKLWEWYISTFYTRAEKNARVLIIGTQWHHDDIIGKTEAAILSGETPNARIINLPAIAEAMSNPYDPREIGAALWPEKFDITELEQIRRAIGSYEFTAQYLGTPTPRDGGMFKREWFKVITADSLNPAELSSARSWDLAASESKGDYTAGALVSRNTDGNWFIRHMARRQGSPQSIAELIRHTANTDGKNVIIGMEQEGGASGKTVIDMYRRTILAGFTFSAHRATGSKEARAYPLSVEAEAGNVFIVQGDWNNAFFDEIETFPNGRNDDQVDSAADAFEMLNDLQRRNIISMENPFYR